MRRVTSPLNRKLVSSEERNKERPKTRSTGPRRMPVPSVESDQFSLTVGSDGPILLQDHYLIEQMANFNRERIPERQPHAKGGGRPPAPSCRPFPLLS